MPLIDLASFPNSRIKPRNPTTQSFQNFMVIPANTPTLFRPTLPQRTDLTIYNSSLTATIRYKRATEDDIQTESFVLGPDRAIDLLGPESVYIFCTEEVTMYYDDGIG